MKMRTKATATMLVVILVISTFSGFINYRSNVRLIQAGMHSNLQTVSTLIQTDIDSKATQAASLASLVVNDPAIVAAVKGRDRERLIQLAVPPFLVQKEKFGIVDGHFHVPPSISFLRVYKTEAFGDDLSKVREIILAAQTEKRALKGIEISATGVSIKGVDVLQDKDGFVGTVEVGISLDSVLSNVKKITGFEAAAFINNDKMNKIATKAPVPDPERIIGGFRNIFATNWSLIRPAATPTLLTTVNDVTYRTGSIHGTFDGLVIVPLLDFKGEQIGSIWALGDFSQYQKELRTNIVLSIAFALLQAALLSALILIVFSSFFLLPLEDVIQKLDALSNGKLEEANKVDIWAKRTDELGTLARAIQKLFTRAINR